MNKVSDLIFRKAACISTAHLSQSTVKLLDDPEFLVCVYPYQYGWFVYWTDDVVVPLDLAACFDWAEHNDVDFIQFDCDGLKVDELPTYNW
jgi:hypothetical protein